MITAHYDGTRKPYKFGFIIGRFNHIHSGHESLINKGLELCENLLVLVGSSQESHTVRNPFNVVIRSSLIHDIYKGRVKVGFIPDLTTEDDISYDWGRYVLDQVHLWSFVHNIRYNPDVMIYGNDEDRAGWYDPEDVQDITQIVVPRAGIPISATKLREIMAKNDIEMWSKFTNPAIKSRFEFLRTKLLQVSEYKEMAESERQRPF